MENYISDHLAYSSRKSDKAIDFFFKNMILYYKIKYSLILYFDFIGEDIQNFNAGTISTVVKVY